MKKLKFTAALLSIIVLITAISVSPGAQDTEKLTFELSAGDLYIGSETEVVLSVKNNNGISGLSLEINYDPLMVKLYSYEFTNKQVSVLEALHDDNRGIIRFTLAATDSFYKSNESLVSMRFTACTDTPGTTGITISNNNKSVSGFRYQPVDYDTAGALINLINKDFYTLPDSRMVIDYDGLTITAYRSNIPANDIKLLLGGSYSIDSVKKLVCTGDRLSVYENGSYRNYSLIILGDINSDGIINYLDYISLRYYILGTVSLGKPAVSASDINGDGVINYLDYIKIRYYILGLSELYQ